MAVPMSMVAMDTEVIYRKGRQSNFGLGCEKWVYSAANGHKTCVKY